MARRGFRGYPLATVAYYGPDDQRASKVVIAVFLQEDTSATALERWFSDSFDMRYDTTTTSAIVEFVQQYAVKSVSVTKGIFGCPHEEGVDYPEGEVCPQCPFWAHKDRFISAFGVPKRVLSERDPADPGRRSRELAEMLIKMR